MPASDYRQFNYGATTYPLAPVGTTLLQDVDPALYQALSFFESVLLSYLAARIGNLSTLGVGLPFTTPVKSKVPYDPAPYLQELQAQFPLLAVYRVSDEYADHTVTWPHRIGRWKAQLVLPPLSAGQMEMVYPILKASGDVLQDRIENTMDPGYLAGAAVWALAGLESIKLVGGTYGRWDAGGNLVFQTATWDLIVKEIVRPPPAGTFQALAGIDTAEDLASPIAPTLNDLVDTKVDFLEPTAVANLSHYFRSDVGVAYDATSNWKVTSFGDQSGAANAAVQTTSANEPQFTQGVFSVSGVSRGAVRFNALDPDYLIAPATALAVDTGKTYFLLARALATTGRQALLAHTLAADTGAHSITVETNTAGGSGGRFGLQLGGSNYDTNAAVDQAWHIHTVRVTTTANAASIASSLTYRIDGAPQSTNRVVGTGNWQGMGTANQLALGALPGLASTTGSSADEAMVLAFARALTDDEITQVETFMRAFMGSRV